MSKFFIYRPIFSWVIAIFVCLFGIIGLTQIPITMYPQVAPPTISIHAVYPGATATQVDETVVKEISNKLIGIEGMKYMSSSSSSGMGSITVTFNPNVNQDMAQVEVQNRMKQVEPKLPAIVRTMGIHVRQSKSNFLMMISFVNKDPNMSKDDVNDIINKVVVPELQRVDGVGNVMFFGGDRAMRIWLDPVKMQALNITPAEIQGAIGTQNVQLPTGSVADTPIVPGTTTTVPMVIHATLNTPEEFGEIIVKSQPDGSTTRLKDVARIELGSDQYLFTGVTNGVESTIVGIQLSNSGNAVATSTAVQKKMEELNKVLPTTIEWTIPMDTSDFISISIEKVFSTLVEAIFLVFLVIFLFLQRVRYTFIPIIVVPIALLGAAGFLWPLGMSLNMLSMFAMVLVIGIVVDDAIVVVENVERIMREEKLPPKEATVKAMSQIQGAIVGITLILSAVFIPMAMVSGSAGNVYRQFAIVMATSILFSGFFALSLTPALCGSILKPHEHDDYDPDEPLPEARESWRVKFFRGFNKWFNKVRNAYVGTIGKVLKHTKIISAIYILLLGLSAFMFKMLPTSFLPVEDQGVLLSSVQLPAGATTERTREVIRELDAIYKDIPEIDFASFVVGFSFAGQGQNAAFGFTTLKSWKERPRPDQSAVAIASKVSKKAAHIQDAFIMVLTPPAIPELGTFDGFNFVLQDRAGLGHEALMKAYDYMMEKTADNKKFLFVRSQRMPDTTQLELDIDREKAAAQGVSIPAVGQLLSSTFGASYIGDFVRNGKSQKVMMQADAPYRMNPDDVMRLQVKNNRGQLVPLSSFIKSKFITAPIGVESYNNYPSIQISGMAGIGVSSSEAMDEMERIASGLPRGFGYEWTGLSLDEKTSGNQTVMIMALSMLMVFLCLAALYESWSIPFAVILAVPLGILGVMLSLVLHGFLNDIFFHVGVITVMGLTAKNAILIVEFARNLEMQGMGTIKATLQAAKLRFRPIVMTSLAFMLGVLPLYTAKGASSISQHEIGGTVLFGMLFGTLLSIFMVPTFYIIVRLLRGGYSKGDKQKMIEDANKAQSGESGVKA